MYLVITQRDMLKSHLPTDSVFYKLGDHGLISFTDYVFLLVVLSSTSFSDLYTALALLLAKLCSYSPISSHLISSHLISSHLNWTWFVVQFSVVEV